MQRRSEHMLASGSQRAVPMCRAAPRPTRAGRSRLLVRAVASPAQDGSITEAQDIAKCPVLSAMPPPPKALAPWPQKLLSAVSPVAWHAAALNNPSLGDAQVVQGAILLQPQILPRTGEAAKQVFAGELEGITTVGINPSAIGTMGDQSLIFAKGEHHKWLRKLMQPAFSNEAIAVLAPSITRVIERYLTKWAAAEGLVQGYHEIKRMTLAVIMQVVLGRELDEESLIVLSDTFTRWQDGLFTLLPFDLPFLPHSKTLRCKEQLSAAIRGFMADARTRVAAGDTSGILATLLTAMDEDGKRLSDKQIEDNILLLLFAGHDTSSTTIALALWRLSMNPHVMDKLRAEQAAIVEKYGPGIDAKVLAKMPYTDAIIRETLRMNNIVGLVTRKAAKDFELGGVRIPKDSKIGVPITWLSENDPRWAHTEGDTARSVFNPDRMLTEEGKQQGWLLPFGGGNRYCLGVSLAMAEMRCFLALLARGYNADAPAATEWKRVILLAPDNGLPMAVTRASEALEN